jgi:hypothetical protein
MSRPSFLKRAAAAIHGRGRLVVRYLRLPPSARETWSLGSAPPAPAPEPISAKDRLSLVLPIKIHTYSEASELERIQKLLLPSLIRFLDTSRVERFLMIAPPDEVDEVRRGVESYADALSIRVMSDDDVLPRLSGTSGWVKQQVLKIAAANFVNTSFMLVLDSDNLMVRPTGYADLVRDGRCGLSDEPMEFHFDWWRGSARMLGFDPDALDSKARGTAITPQMMRSEVFRSLQRRIETVNARAPWENVLMRNPGWSEYSMYYLHLTRDLERDDYHFEDDPKLLGAAIWHEPTDANAAWAEKLFADPPSYFTLVQSSLPGATIDHVAEVVAPHLA